MIKKYTIAHNATVAVMVPDREKLQAFAEERGKRGLDFSLLCKDPGLTKAVQDVVTEHAKVSEGSEKVYSSVHY